VIKTKTGIFVLTYLGYISFLQLNSRNCCAICGGIEGKDCVEIFGIIFGEELGCSACIGVTHFPHFGKSDS
jgi:hypothetical protein